MAGIKRNGILGRLLRDSWVVLAGVSHEGCLVRVVTGGEASSSGGGGVRALCRPAGVKAGAVVCAARGVGLGAVAGMVGRVGGDGA